MIYNSADASREVNDDRVFDRSAALPCVLCSVRTGLRLRGTHLQRLAANSGNSRIGLRFKQVLTQD